MGFRYRTGDRVFGGSMEPRLNPDCVDARLNTKLRPSFPSPLVRATGNDRALPDPYPGRKELTGLKNKSKGEY
jgi:hypothetical protein